MAFSENEVREFWNRIAPSYEPENEKISETHGQRFVEAIKYIGCGQNSKILNAWARTGKAIDYIREKCSGACLINLELSEALIGVAKTRHPGGIFIQSSLQRFPFKDSQFDFVLSLETLEHTQDSLGFLKEAGRVLKSHGTLVLSTPPATAEIVFFVSDLLKLHHSEGPHKCHSPKEVKDMLQKSGFKLLLHKGTLLVPAGPKFLRRLGSWLDSRVQGCFLKELGIRQFFVCEKEGNGNEK